MSRYFNVILLVSVVFGLSACNMRGVNNPDVTLSGGAKIEAEVGNYDGDRDGKHCPPGHHMKGWC